MSAKARATKFEEDIKKFLIQLGFKDVDGASDAFKIGGEQVDACGGFEDNDGSKDTLLVIECTMTSELRGKSLRGKLKAFRGAIINIGEGLREHPIYGKYRNVRYILATKGIDVRPEDYAYANNGESRIYIWDENFRKYYDDLHQKIGKYAKFSMMGEMGIRPAAGTMIQVPAFMTEVKGSRMFAFVMSPKDLLPISYVARREVRNERFYQRIIDKGRLTEISQYVDTGNILPNNIIVAFNEDLKGQVKYHVLKDGKRSSPVDWPLMGVSYGMLEFPKDYRSCWIIDGQHRLFAFAFAKTDLHVPVVAFDNLPLEDQGKIFLDINKFQKPVPSDLVWDLNGDMVFPSEDGIISRAVKQLNADRNGALYHIIYIPSTGIRVRQDLLKMSGICNSIKKAHLAQPTTRGKVQNPFYSTDPDKAAHQLASGIGDFLSCVKNKMGDEWNRGSKGFVLSNSGMAIIIGLFELIVSRSVLKSNALNVLCYTPYVDALRKALAAECRDAHSLKQLKLRITSEAGRSEYLKELAEYIAGEIDDPQFASDLASPYGDKAREIERKLKAVIAAVIGDPSDPEWFFTKIGSKNKSIQNEVQSRMRKDYGASRDKAHTYMTLGESVHVIREMYWDSFKSIFIGGDGFATEDELDAAFSVVSRVRSKRAHPSGAAKTRDLKLFKIHEESLRNCLDAYLGTAEAKEGKAGKPS